jgi:hypothetical protein
MWRDRWLILGVIGAALSCVACLTLVVVLAFGALGLGAWTGHLDAVLAVLLVGSIVVIAYRYWTGRRMTP